MSSHIRRYRARLVFVAAAVMFIGAMVSAVWAQGPAQTAGKTSVWDGVYTAEQAARGKAIFMANCAVCHGPDGKGTGTRRSHDIPGHWEEATLDEFFSWVKTRMPQSAPGTLTPNTYIDAIAFVLELNGWPAGPRELPPDSEYLNTISIWSKREGPAPPTTGTLVQSVGCLTAGPSGTWFLTNSTDPRRTRASTPSAGVDLQRVRALPLGAQKLQLLAAFPSDSEVGKKIEAKGLFVSNAAGNRITLQALTVLADTCAP